jgi:tryptophan synthase beta subunit
MQVWGCAGGGEDATGMEHDNSPSEHIAIVQCLTVYCKTEQVSAAAPLKTGTQGLVVRIPGYLTETFIIFLSPSRQMLGHNLYYATTDSLSILHH